jgi:hypothetical protein
MGRIRRVEVAWSNDLFISLGSSMQPDVLISEGKLFSLVDQEQQ